MRFTIEVEKVDAKEWSVKVSTAATRNLIHTRRIQRSGNSPAVFPQPPASEVGQLKPTDMHYKLCTTANTSDMFDVYGRIINKDLKGNDVKAFGRYLFATLIGDDAWQNILAEAEEEPIELALLWSETEWELHRLPWEMMRNETDALAADPRVSLTRLVPNSKAKTKTISLRPKVLFVVGSDLNDAKVKPGTEYLGMLRRLEDRNLRLITRILDRATSQQVEDELEAFQPSVVHFICHGGFDIKGNAYLEMTPEKPTDPPKQIFASSLLSILKTTNGLPQVVVLNACYSATPPPMREAAPLAFELVKGGIPVVVGMGGRVADVACRLFTRRFYEALLKGESVVDATAHGRRAGIKHIGAQVESSVDWAMPTLFLDKSLTPKITLDPVWVAQVQQIEQYAGKYRSINNPPLFCDRHEIVESYHKLLDVQPKGAGVQPSGAYRVLAVEGDAWEPKVKDPQYGKTRLLEELASQAARDGHVPCLITFSGNAPPVKVMQLGEEILGAIWRARKTLNLNTQPNYEFRKLEQRQADPTIKLSQDVQEELDFKSPEGKVVRAAIKLDLLALQHEARIKLNNPSLRVLVLIDEVHRFDDAAREFVHNMIDSAGLGSDADPVPVVFTFSAVNVKPEYNSTVQMLQEFLNKRPLYVNRLPLGAFRPPKDEWILYQQFLINQEPPLIIPPDKEDQGIEVYDVLFDLFMGVPSQLNGIEVQAAIRMAKTTRNLIEADDDDVLRKHP